MVKTSDGIDLASYGVNESDLVRRVGVKLAIYSVYLMPSHVETWT
jgi:hypothetical protein